MIDIRRYRGVTFLIACLCACGDDGPTGSGALAVQPFSTATETGASGVLVQVRLRVTAGLNAFSTAVESGRAGAQVCEQQNCVSGLVVLGTPSPTCAAAPTTDVGSIQLGFAGAGFGGDAVGVDFCVQNLTNTTVFELTLTDGVNASNVTRTSCIPAGQGLVCDSD